MATIGTYKGVVKLTKAQLETLVNTGTVTDGTTTITYSPDDTIYLTPQEEASTTTAGVIQIATDQEVADGINTTKAITPAQLKSILMSAGIGSSVYGSN